MLANIAETVSCGIVPGSFTTALSLCGSLMLPVRFGRLLLVYIVPRVVWYCSWLIHRIISVALRGPVVVCSWCVVPVFLCSCCRGVLSLVHLPQQLCTLGSCGRLFLVCVVLVFVCSCCRAVLFLVHSPQQLCSSEILRSSLLGVLFVCSCVPVVVWYRSWLIHRSTSVL